MKFSMLLTTMFFCLQLQPARAEISPALLNWDGDNMDGLPKTWSETGINLADTSQFKAYEVNVPQYRDMIQSERYIHVPADQTIKPGDSLNYTFPAGVVFVRYNYLDTIYNNSASRVKIEYQLQIRIDTNWHRLVYAFKDGGTEAKLLSDFDFIQTDYTVNITGANLPYIDTTVNPPAPLNSVTFKYFRFSFDCINCHWDNSANGFITQQLNKGDQINTLVSQGVLSAAPDFAGMQTRGAITQWKSMDDAAATQEEKVFSYLGGNCGYCHNHMPERQVNGMLTSFTYWTKHAGLPEFVNDSGPIIAGRPDISDVITKMRQANMPLAEVKMPDAVFIKTIWDWTNSLDGDPANDALYPYPSVPWVKTNPVPHGGISPMKFSIQNRVLHLPGQLKKGQVAMYSLLGNQVKLEALANNYFKIPQETPEGVYFLKMGSRATPVILGP